MGTDSQAILSFRIPQELYRPRERLHLEVIARDEAGSFRVLWARRYETSWRENAPHLDPMTDLLSEPPDSWP